MINLKSLKPRHDKMKTNSKTKIIVGIISLICSFTIKLFFYYEYRMGNFVENTLILAMGFYVIIMFFIGFFKDLSEGAKSINKRIYNIENNQNVINRNYKEKNDVKNYNNKIMRKNNEYIKFSNIPIDNYNCSVEKRFLAGQLISELLFECTECDNINFELINDMIINSDCSNYELDEIYNYVSENYLHVLNNELCEYGEVNRYELGNILLGLSNCQAIPAGNEFHICAKRNIEISDDDYEAFYNYIFEE